MWKARTNRRRPFVARPAAAVESVERREMFASSHPAPPAPILTGTMVNPALPALTALFIRKAGDTPIDFFLPDGDPEGLSLTGAYNHGTAEGARPLKEVR